MTISDKKLRQVYSTLQKGGYSEDYDTFMRGFAGNENYQNRKNVYDLLKGAGADIGDTYEDFIGNLQSDNKGSGNYVYNPDGISPAEEKKEEVQPVINVENTEDDGVDDATFADYMRGIQAGMRQTRTAIDRTNKAVEYGQKNLGPNVKPAKLDIADNRNVMEEEVYNPETMQMEKQYTTSYGDTYQDKFSAKQEQDKIDLKNRFDSLQRGIEKERQSVYAEVDAEIEKLQKQIATLNAMKKDGEPKQVEGYRQQAVADLENKIADLQEKRGEFDKEAEFRANKFLYENSGMKEQVEESLKQANEAVYEMNKDDKVRQAIDAVQRNSPFLVLRGAAAGAENLYDLVKRWSNPEYGKSVATQRKLSDASKDTELALGKDDNTWMTHLLRGAWDGATDIRTWDFGINDMTDMSRLYQLQAKADRIAQKELAGEESEEKLTASEQKMLDAIALSNTIEANFSEHVPMSYRVGKSVPESIGFAAAIAMNPASGLGKSIGKKAARRLIANGMTTMRYGKWGVKALSAGARVGGDALEALSTTLTTALPRTVEGVFEDMAGTAQGRYDEQGNLVFDKVTDMERNTMKAVGKGIYTNWMENQSEMVGEYFRPIGNFIRQATKNRAWMRNAVDVILGSDDAAKKSLIGKFRDRAKINGVFGEYTEEVYNNVMNAVPWGDMNMTGGVMRPNRADYKTEKEYEKAMDEWRGSVFNAETNVETFLSVTAMIFPMGAVELGGRYLNAYTTKAQLDVAIDNLNKTIGQEQASAIMNEMRNAESLQDMSKIYLTAMQDGRIKDGKQARALLDAVGRLVAYQSVNTSQANSTITEDKFERDYRNAYDAGHEMPIENKHKAGLEYERSMQELDRVLGDSFQGIAGMPFEQFQRLMQTLTPEQRSVAQEYYLQSARLAGMRDASMEEADKQVQMHYNTLRRVADKNGIVYRGSSLEEGEFISPESMRIPNSRMLVVLNADNPGASRVIAREEAGEITTSEMDEELRTMQEGLRLKAQNDYLWGVMHNPSTKMPQVGETIEYDEDGSGNGKRMRVIGFNDQGQVQLLPTYIDGETMEEKVSSGEPVVMSKYEALKRQDSYYDALEAEQSATETEGQTVINPVTEGLNDSNIETSSQTETAPENDVTILTDEQVGVIDNWLNAEDDTNLVHARIDSVGDDVWSNDTKQAMHQYVDSVRRQQTETDSQQTQTTDSQQEQTTELPRDEKGNVLYHKAPIETTVADLMDGSLEDDEIDAFVEANITSAQKEVDKRTKDKPVMNTNKEKYLQEKAKWKENLTEAEGILAYWNTVKDAIDANRNSVTDTDTETAPEQTEDVTESMTRQNESSNESSTEQTEGETAPAQTEGDTETAPAQTEGDTEADPVQNEGETETTPAQNEGETETTPKQTGVLDDRNSLRAEGEENSEEGLEMQPEIVEPIDDTNAEGEITPIEDMDEEEETQDIFDRAEMLREREQAEKLLSKEIARINRMAKNARWVDSYRKDGTLSRKQIRAMENLASKLGLKIEWHETMAENGLYDPKTRTIHIALDAQNPIDAVFGHETMHKIAENEEDYDMMRNLAIEILGAEEFNRRADKAEELYKSHDYNYDRAYYEQEVVCDFMGDMLHDNELLERVSWNANHRVLSAIRDVLDRIISGLGLVDENLVRVRTVVSAAYNNAIRRAEENKDNVTVEEERKGTNAPEMTDEEEEIITKAKDNGTYMKAPNGEQSNLSPRQWVQVRTEAFKKWFGDWENDPANASKVVDENGEPLVVYNGGRGGNFTKFSKDKITDSNNLGKGFYFTPIKKAAESYRDSFGWDDYNDDGSIKQEVLDSLHLKDVFLNIRNMGNNNESLDTNTNIDGSYSTSGLQYVVRNPNQIKSATDNIGTFDGNNPDIRYSLRKGTDVPGMTDEERALRYEGDSDIRFSIRTEPDPKRTIKVYKLMRLGEDGKLYPLFIGNTEEIVPGTWYNADSPALKDLKSLPADTYNSTYTATVDGAKVKKEYTYASYLVNNETGEAIPISQFIENMKKEGDERFSKMKGIPNADAIRWATENGYRWIRVEDNGNKQTRYGGDTKSYYNYGINGAGSVGKFAMRPGWHAGSLPTMRQIGKGSKKNLRDDNFVWVEGEIPADIDYNDEASKNPDRDIPDRIPKDGYYMKATNADKTKSQAGAVGWYVAGAFKANRVISDDEARSVIDKFNMEHEGQLNGKVEYDYEREGGMPFGEEDAKKVNERLGANMPELTDDIFSQAEEIRDNEQARASLRNNSRGVGLTYTAMQRAWDREMSRASFFAKEGYWDYLASVDEFQKLIARETGREISSMEDTYRAMLSLSSKNANDMKQFDSLLALPLQKAILKLIGATKNYDRGPGRELCDYLMAKHGIERNRDMAVRNALKEKNTDENGLDRAAYGNDLDMYYASVDKVLIDAEQNGYSWRKTEELLDQTAESYGADLSVDYSGLQGMYTDDGADEYVDYRTAKQSAIRDVEYYESIKDKDDLEEMWDAVRAISSYSLVKQSQSGLTNEDYLRDQMRRYRYFVPLRGFAEDTAEEMYDYIDADRTNGGLGSPVKTAKGHQHKSGDPIGNLLNVAYRSIASGNKNMAISHLYNLATTRDTGGILKVSKIWLENKGTKDDPDWVMVTPNLTDPSTGGPEMSGEDVQAELDRFEKEMLWKKEQGLVMQVTDTSVTPPYRIEQKQHNKSHQIRVNVAGRPRIITVVGNPRLAMAMNGLLNPQTSAWKGLSVLNNFLSAAFTSVNPSFGAANLVRDSLHSNMRMFVSESPLYWAKYTARQKMLVGNAANWARMLTMLRDYQNGRRPSGQRAQMFKEFMDGGGATGYTMIRNQEESIQFAKDVMKELKKGKTSKVNPMRLFDLFSYANEAAELVNRFLAYETSREMGRTIERSINDAKEATLNFNRKGAGTKSLTDKRGIAYTLANALNYYSQYGRSFLIFFNAFAQGQRQLWEMAKANPGKFTMAFGVVPAVTAGIALPMLNNVLLPAIYSMASGDGDDDEYVDYYDDLSDWERHHNLCIRAGKSWIKIPLSPELSAMYALGDVIGGAVWGKREMSGSDLMVLADLMVPNNVDTSQPKVTAAAYAPSAVRPLVNVGINMDFRGRPISKEGSYNKYSPAWRKATRSTSKSLTALSRALNAASGGSDERQGVLDVSPGYVQEMMTGLAGGYMSTTLAVSDALLPVHLAGGGTEQSFAAGAKALWDRGGVPIISRFYVPGSGERKTSRAKSQYYETVVPMMQQVQGEYTLIRGITREAKQDMVRADARLKDAQASGDTIAIAEALQGKERAEQALREAALEQETKTKELMSSGRWRAYTEMLGLTRYVDEMLKVYGQGELPDNVNDAMRSAVEIAKDLDKDD